MSSTCTYCRARLVGQGLSGRPRADRSCGSYCCYGCLSLGEQTSDSNNPKPNSGIKLDGFALKIGIGLLVASQSMIFGLAINLEETTPRPVKLVVQGTILAGTMLVMAILAGPLVRNAIAETRRKKITIEALFLLTMIGAFAASIQSFLSGQGPIYFEVVTVLLVVYSLGKAIGARSRAAAIASTQAWASSINECRLVDDRGRERFVAVTAILPGDLVEVRPGENIAIDGIVQSGIGYVSEAVVSGEPFPVVRRPGDAVSAGMASHDATFRIRANAPGCERRIDSLLRAVEEAREQPSSLLAQADRLGQWFLPIIVVVAILTFGFWTVQVSWQTGLFNAMSVLLVACPCALGLATPIVVWSALNRLAERGIVAHTGDFFEKLATVDRIVFDKTGTLTEEHFGLLDVVTVAAGPERQRILALFARIESQSKHPLATAFAALPQDFAEEEAPQIDAFRVVPGCGVEAEITVDSRHLLARIGRPDWLTGDEHSGRLKALENQLLARSGHDVAFELDGELVALAVVSERLRDSVPEMLTTCRAMKLPVELLTGDRSPRATDLGFANAKTGLLPEEKQAHLIAQVESGSRPLMIGDGINDASAMVAAHVSIALSSGTDLANRAATATLYHGDLRSIPWAIGVSRTAIRAVRQNLRRAVIYNLVGIVLAALGLLHPVVAALLMVVSSLLVTWSSVRVGVAPPLCCDVQDLPEKPVPSPASTDKAKAGVHFVALALQGGVALLLLNLSIPLSLITIGSFLLMGLVFATLWSRWSRIPHALDMTIGMLTLGNLGMLLGWWADNGFTRIHDGGCCECVRLLREGVLKPWMWLGMLLFGNLAMSLLGRRSHAEIAYCKTAMFTGGNLGMVFGMAAGGWLGTVPIVDSVPVAAFLSFLGMSVGMIAGMLLGYELTRRMLPSLFRLRLLPGWLLQGGKIT